MNLTRDQKEKMLAKVRFKKCFFLKNFLIGYVVLILAFLISMFMYDNSVEMCHRIFGASYQFVAFAYVLIFGMWKILIAQFALVPFLSAFFMERHLSAK